MDNREGLSIGPPNPRRDGGWRSGAVWSWTVFYLYCCFYLWGGKALIASVCQALYQVKVSPVPHSHMDPKEGVVFAEGTGAPLSLSEGRAVSCNWAHCGAPRIYP